MEKLITPKQLCELLQVDQSTVYWWSHIGFIPHLKIGKLVRFREVDINQWLLSRRKSGRKQLKLEVSNLP